MPELRRETIFFDCPECGEEMEISSRKRGEVVECIECGEEVEVPQRGNKRRPPQDEGLSSTEYMLFTILFLFIPVANVFVSSILYYVWKGNNKPVRANQINTLGFVIFGCHLLLGVLIAVLSASLNNR